MRAWWAALAAVDDLVPGEVEECSSLNIATAIAATCGYPHPADLVGWVDARLGRS